MRSFDLAAIGIVGIVYNSVVRRSKGLDQHIDEAEPLVYYTTEQRSSVSPPHTPTRATGATGARTAPGPSPVQQSPGNGAGTPRGGSRENLVAMLA